MFWRREHQTIQKRPFSMCMLSPSVQNSKYLNVNALKCESFNTNKIKHQKGYAICLPISTKGYISYQMVGGSFQVDLQRQYEQRHWVQQGLHDGIYPTAIYHIAKQVKISEVMHLSILTEQIVDALIKLHTPFSSQNMIVDIDLQKTNIKCYSVSGACSAHQLL